MELERAYHLAQLFADAGFDSTITVAAGEPPYTGASLVAPVPVNVERLTKLAELLNDDALLQDHVHLWIKDEKLSVGLE